MSKEFGHLSRDQIRRAYSFLGAFNEGFSELVKIARENDKIDTLIIPWAHLYEIPYPQCLAIFLVCIGLDDSISEAAKAEDPQEAALSFAETELENTELPDDFDEEDKQIFTAMLMVLTGNVEAIKRFSLPMSELISRVGKGDDEALFQAITIDRSVVACSPINKRICIAQLKGDESFMDRLSKAITRTKPARPKVELDDFRYMMEAMADGVGLEQFKTTQIEDILQHDLGLYTNDSDYSLRALRKLIQKRNERVGT